MIETGTNLEVTGIRVAKYVPDFTTAYKGADITLPIPVTGWC